MSILFVLLLTFSVLGLIIGLIRPKIFRLASRKLVIAVFGTAIIVCFVGTAVTVPKPTQPVVADNQNTSTTNDTQSTDSTTEPVATTPITNTSSVTPTVTTPQESQLNTSTQYTYYPVTDVVDGDTIKISMDGTSETIRLIGIDTPEVVDPRKPVECFGKQASAEGKSLLSGKKVRIEKDTSQGERDKYGRLLAYVYRDDGLFYNDFMVKNGYAHEYTYNTPYKYQTQFKADQQAAESAQIGLWSPTTCNGNTGVSSGTNSSTTTTTQGSTATTTGTGAYYTSSYSTSKYYYPTSCTAWQSLDSKYLQSYSTLQALLKVYPSKTQSPSCQ